MAVLAHMNQPLGSCLSFVAEVAAAAQPQVEPPARASGTEGDGHYSEMMEDVTQWTDTGEAIFHETNNPDHNMAGSDSRRIQNSLDSTTQSVEKFPGAGCTFGRGKSFLEDFNSDPYAASRQMNLYYPFASKEEWELASFLLLSGLSMANITKFLSLKLVCSF
jgi:hypothetical protein